MGMKTGHPILSAELKLIAVTRNRVMFEGPCGERFNIAIEEWPKLRSMLNNAVNRAKKVKPNPVMMDILGGGISGQIPSRW